MKNTFFPTRQNPIIYAYSDTRFASCHPPKLPNQNWEILLEENAIREDEFIN